MSTNTIPHLRNSALGLAAEGLSVIPVRLEFDGHKVNKKPAIDWKPYQTTIADPQIIAAWFANPSVNGIGLVIGPATWEKWPYLYVVDVEAEHRAEAEEHLDELLGPQWRDRTWWNKTISGGLHVFFQAWEPVKTAKFAWGDIKGENSLVVVPPSGLPDGRGYRWGRFEGDPTPLNPADLNLPGVGRNGDEDWKPLDVAEALKGVPQGQRNITLFRLACRARAFDLPIDWAIRLVSEAAANCTPPWGSSPGEEPVEKMVERAYRRYQPNPELIGRLNAEADAPQNTNTGHYNTPPGQRSVRPEPNTNTGQYNTPPGQRSQIPPLIPASELGARGGDVEWFPFLGSEGFVGRGLVTLLSARPKAGKTTLLAYAVRPWLEAGKKVVWLSEEPEGVWWRRLEELSIPKEGLFFLFLCPDNKYLEAIKEARPDVVIVDTLRAFIRIKDENDAALVHEALAPWIALTRELGFALILCHHRNKSGGEEGTDHAGSHAFVGDVDIAISMRLEGGPDSPRRLLETLSRFSETPRSLVIELTEGGYGIIGSPAEVERKAVKERILEVLEMGLGEAEGWVTLEELKQELGSPAIAERTLRRALEDLVKAGKVERRHPAPNRPAAFRLITNTGQPLSILASVSDLGGAVQPNTNTGQPDSILASVGDSGEVVRETQPNTNTGQPNYILASVSDSAVDAETERNAGQDIDAVRCVGAGGEKPNWVEHAIVSLACHAFGPNLPNEYWPIVQQYGLDPGTTTPDPDTDRLLSWAKKLSMELQQHKLIGPSVTVRPELGLLLAVTQAELQMQRDYGKERGARKPPALPPAYCKNCGAELLYGLGRKKSLCLVCEKLAEVKSNDQHASNAP